MKTTTLKQIYKFRDDRNWKQFHNGKDLAISLALESSELLENFQWSQDDLYCHHNINNIKEELADIIMYAILMADVYQLDLDQIIEDKLKLNNQKYPVELSKNSSRKYTQISKIIKKD